MATDKVTIDIDSKADLRGFKQAESAATKLNRTVKGLAATLGIAYGTKAVVKFGKAAAKAFLEDQKQATRLANAVRNLGLELSNPAISTYIDKLTLASGVSDSQLRPALQALLTTTGDLTKSQDLLSQAIDISSGSGVALETVAQDLANAYVGKTKALSKYNLGLTQAELKTAKFTDIQKKLNDQYKGANAAFLNTYAGKMQALGVAAGEAQEKIGGALIDSLMSLSGAGSIDDLIKKIDTLAEKTASWIDQFTEGLLIFKAYGKDFKKNFFNPFAGNDNQLNKDIQAAQVDRYNKTLRRNYMKAWEGITTPAQAAEQKKAASVAAKRAKELAAAQNKQTAELKKQAALKKASKLFDLEQIQLVAALKGKLSEEDKIRVEAQIALLNDNVGLATKLTKEILMAQDATGGLYKYFKSIPDAKNPFGYLDQWIKDFQTKMDNLKFPVPTTETNLGGNTSYNGNAYIPPGFGFPEDTASVSTNATLASGTPFGQAGSAAASALGTPFGQAGTTINVTVQGNVIKEQDLINTIQAGTQLNSLSGSPSQIGRIQGMFGL